MSHSFDASPSFHIGAERWFYEAVAARLGYRIGLNDNPSNGLALGIGVRRSGDDALANIDFQFDYAFVPDTQVGNAHRVSVINPVLKKENAKILIRSQ